MVWALPVPLSQGVHFHKEVRPLHSADCGIEYPPIAPATPSDVMVVAASSTVLQVTWRGHGNQNYSVHYHLAETADPSQLEVWPDVAPQTQSPFVVMLEDLEPFTNYSIIILGTTVCGTEQSTLVMGTTQEAPPTTPPAVTVVAILPTRIKVQFDAPEQPNGVITSYNVSL